jgi:hypothetical protein
MPRVSERLTARKYSALSPSRKESTTNNDGTARQHGRLADAATVVATRCGTSWTTICTITTAPKVLSPSKERPVSAKHRRRAVAKEFHLRGSPGTAQNR